MLHLDKLAMMKLGCCLAAVETEVVGSPELRNSRLASGKMSKLCLGDEVEGTKQATRKDLQGGPGVQSLKQGL